MNNNFNPETQNQNPDQNPYAGQQNYGNYTQYQQPNQGQYQAPNYQPNYVDESGMFNENRMARINGTSASVKISDWLKVDCLSFLTLIPCIGSIAYIVIYCILAFSSKTNKSMKARYQASLIWAAIGLGLYLVIFIVLFGILGLTLGELANEFSAY